MTEPAPPVARPLGKPVWLAAAAVGTTLFLLAALLAPTPVWLNLIAILALGWWLPGLLLALLWRLPDVSWPALLLHALGLGLCWLIAGSLLVHYIPGDISRTLLLAVYGVGALVLAAGIYLRRAACARARQRAYLALGPSPAAGRRIVSPARPGLSRIPRR